MRAYFFGNMYLSSIQQGIQAGHVIAEMAVKYCPTGNGFSTEGHMLYDWAENHKTMILLNAGYSENIQDLMAFFHNDDNPYPHECFYEGQDALNGALTCTGIILPEKIYEGAAIVRRLRRNTDEYMLYNKHNILEFANGTFKENVEYTNFEKELMERLSKFRMAQ